MDLLVISNKPVSQNHNYALVCVDAYTSFAVVHLMRSKKDTSATVQGFVQWVDTQFKAQLESVRADRGTEFLNKSVQTLMHGRGIEPEWIPREDHNANAKGENFIGKIQDLARTLAHDAGAPERYQAHALMHAAWLWNRTPHQSTLRARDDIIPWVEVFGQKPDLHNARPWGCKAYGLQPERVRRTTFGPRSAEYVFLGLDGSGARLLSLETKKVSVPRADSVVYVEDAFPWKQPEEVAPDSKVDEEPQPAAPPPPVPVPVPQLMPESDDEDTDDEDSDDEDKDDGMDMAEEKKGAGAGGGLPPAVPGPAPAVAPAAAPAAGRPRREHQPPGEYWMVNMATKVDPDTPTTVRQALAGDDAEDWLAAIDKELDALDENKTYEVVQVPAGAKLLPSKWVFAIKSDGRKKARLVACGNFQSGLDTAETFAPTSRAETVRACVASGVQRGMRMLHVDVSSAYLNSKLPEDKKVYLRMPAELRKRLGIKPDANVCMLLKKVLYGLCEGAKAWNDDLGATLKAEGWKPNPHEPGAYFKEPKYPDGHRQTIPGHVDDLLVFTNNEEEEKELIAALQRKYKITTGEPSVFAGLRITLSPDKEFVDIDVADYIKKTLCHFGMDNCNSAPTPYVVDQDLAEMPIPQTEEEKAASKRPYRELVGSLLYISVSARPDISVAVGEVARYCENPGDAHWKAAKRILRYLAGTLDYRLRYRRSDSAEEQQLSVYCDANYMDTHNKRSTSGYVSFYAGGPVSWRSVKQRTVATSTMHAEVHSLNEGGREAVWLKNLIECIEGRKLGPVPIYEDNKGAMEYAQHPTKHHATKHYAVKCTWIREQVKARVFKLEYVRTTEQKADIMTKKLSSSVFKRFVKQLLVSDAGERQ